MKSFSYLCAFAALFICATGYANTKKPATAKTNTAAKTTIAKNTFVIDGTVDDEINDAAYLVFISDANFNIPKTPSDTIYVKNKKFTYTNSDFDEVRLMNLQAIFPDGSLAQAYIDFVIVPGERATLKVCNGYYETGGTKFFDELSKISTAVMEARQRLNEISGRLNTIDKLGLSYGDQFYEAYLQYLQENINYQTLLWKYLPEHNTEEGTLFFYLRNKLTMPFVVREKMAPEVLNGRLSKFIDVYEASVNREKNAENAREQQLAKNYAETQPGRMFKDFEVEFEGKTQRLSDYVGKGKYVLVDFWASWCGPCRQETPNIKAVYEKYKGDNFEVVGIACWDQAVDTRKAIKEEGITYPQIFNTDQIATDLYGINGIPHIILFGPDGKILYRNLRGAAIEIAVKAVLKK